MTYESYWNAVLGANRSAEQVVAEFALTADTVAGWLYCAEVSAAEVSEDFDTFLVRCAPHTGSALEDLRKALEA